MPEWPHRGGSQRSTGGKARLPMAAANAASDWPATASGGRVSGIGRSCHCAPGDAIRRAMPTNPSTAIVTGAAKGVGRAIAEALLADGWTVIAHSHHEGDDIPEGAVGIA